MRRGFCWIGWIGWAFATLAAPFFAGRIIATVWAWTTWPLFPGPRSLYPPESVSDGEAFASSWMRWGDIGWTLALFFLVAGAFVFGAVRLPAIRSLSRNYSTAVAWLLVLGQAACWSFAIIRTDPYWDVFTIVPE